MDPASHLLFGQTVAFSVRRRLALRGVTAALVLGSVLPDSDALLVPRGYDVYLRAHAAGTHSLLGAVVEAFVLALVVRMLLVGSRVLPLLLASLAGVTGHVFWDLADGSDINLLRPFSESVFGWHLVAMGEPIVIALLGSAALVAWRWPAHAQRTAAATLISLGVFLAVKKTTQDWARAQYAVAIGDQTPQAFAIAPNFGSLFAWTIYDRIDDRVRAWRVDGRRGTMARAFEYRDAADARAVVVARELPVVRTLLALSRIPFVRTELDGTSRLVLWSDISSCSIRGCAVSFGGAFDGNSTALYQLIRIGGFSQRRALPLGRQ